MPNKIINADSTMRESGFGNNVITITDDITIGKDDNGNSYLIATDAKTITLADACPIGMRIRVGNEGADNAVLIAIVGSATVGVGGWNNVLAGTRTLLTRAVGKELRNTKATALKYDYVELEKVSATEWNAITYGIWTKEA